MFQKIGTLAVVSALVAGLGLGSVDAAEREQVRTVINLVSGVKMLFPEHLRNNASRTEFVKLDTDGAMSTSRPWGRVRKCFASATNRRPGCKWASCTTTSTISISTARSTSAA